MRKKIAVVSQRYGIEVNGGAEYYTRMLAEHLQNHYDIEILTTTALNHETWENYYPEGKQLVHGIPVRRFRVKRQRSVIGLRIIDKLLRTIFKNQEWLERLWILKQGPYCPDMIQYIGQSDYDAYIFVTYLYYPTAMGMLMKANKSILVPTAHDEPCIYLTYYKKIFCSPKAIVFLTEEEHLFVERLFDGKLPAAHVLGMGIDVPSGVEAERFRKKYSLQDDYILYVGRIDSGKKCDEMFMDFLSYKKQYATNLKLVVMGKATIEIPMHPDILPLGFVAEQDKYDGIKGALALILPSEHESLSISVLEAMALGIPVLVNGRCEVLKGHVERSQSGFCYKNQQEFVEGVRRLTQEGSSEVMQDKAAQYVKDNYGWDQILKGYCSVIDAVWPEEGDLKAYEDYK